MSTIEMPGLAKPLVVADRIRLKHGGHENRWWTVKAVDERFVVVTRQEEFKPKGVSCYTILDWVRGVRGPCDLSGQGWDVDEPNGCAELLRALNYHLEVDARLDAGEGSVSLDEASTQVSYRNNVEIVITEVFVPKPARPSQPTLVAEVDAS